MRKKIFFGLILTVAFLLVACSSQAPSTPQATEAASPTANEAPTPVVSEYQPVKVVSVEVRVGFGSPIPVHVLVSGDLPDSCAQLNISTLERDGNTFTLQLNAESGAGENCIADSLPFTAEIPLNVVNLPQGTYQVDVNGVTAEFDPFGPPVNLQQFDGISFSVAPWVATGAQGESVPENPGSPDGPYWEKMPAYDLVSLEDYPVTQSVSEPQIAVYPVQAYRQISPEASQILDSLQTLLAEKPIDPRQVPSLPVINAGQIFLSNVKYLDFQNGSGVRFLAVYGQALNPVTNDALVYGFQGLSSDGRYAVSIFLPVNHASLLDNTHSLSQADIYAMLDDYGKYTANIAADLMAQPADSFNPDLDALDRLVTSLNVEK